MVEDETNPSHRKIDEGRGYPWVHRVCEGSSMSAKYQRHFEVLSKLLVVYDGDEEVVHTLRLDELFPMVQNPIGGILIVTTKLTEKIVIANDVPHREKNFLIEIVEEAIGENNG
jgi:hypothetical protein